MTNKNKIIRISQKDLEKIVKEAIRRYIEFLSTKNDVQQPNEIPDMSDLVKNISYANKDFVDGNEDLSEGLIHTYDIKKVKKIICRKFNLLPQQFLIDTRTDNGTLIELPVIILSNNTPGNIVGDIKHMMGTCGYFEATDPIQRAGFFGLVFEPHFSKDISEEIREKYNFLYHATPSIYVQKILKIGLVPKNKNTLFFYPSRIYCMRGNNLSEDQIQIINNIQRERAKTAKTDDNSYTILVIDVSFLPRDIKFFVDPMAPDAILTHNNIPPVAISVYGDLKDFQKTEN